MRISVINQFITVFVNIYNFLHFSESTTQDRISRRYRVLQIFYKILFWYIFDIICVLVVSNQLLQLKNVYRNNFVT